MKLFVLDASAWIRLYLPDGPLPAGLDEAVRALDRGETFFAAPELILSETAHALCRKRERGFITAPELKALWKDMRAFPLDLRPISDDVESALELSLARMLTAYDAQYLALAMRLGAPLFTADDRLKRAAAGMGLAN